MDADTLSIASSIASLVLAVIATWQAVYFYTQTKNTETRVETTLASINAQVQTLQSINAKTLDRLTKYVTSPRDEPSAQLVQALSTSIEQSAALFQKIQAPGDTAAIASIKNELVITYIAIWYYSATTNVWASFSLPPVQEFSEDVSYHSIVKNILDKSSADFVLLSNIVNQLTDGQVDASGLRHFYDEVRDTYIHMVGDTAHHFTKQSRA